MPGVAQAASMNRKMIDNARFLKPMIRLTIAGIAWLELKFERRGGTNSSAVCH